MSDQKKVAEKDRKFVWIDLEMTGLRPEVDSILEIATIITDSELNIIDQGPEIVIAQPEEKLAVMDDFVTKLHAKSGLTEKVRASKISLEQAQDETLSFIAKHCEKNSACLAGNSVWQDRAFLYVYMPNIINYLHYRLLDVSSIKLVIKRWYAENKNIEFKKSDTHRALVDIQESIEELKHYRKYFFVPVSR